MTAPTSQQWIRLEDAKRYLRFDPQDTSDDLTLQAIADAAAAMIEDIKGHVETGTVTGELVEVGNFNVVFLAEGPVLEVTAVRLFRGDGTTVDIPQASPTSIYGYATRGSVAAGVLQVPGFGEYACPRGSFVSVDYRYGLDPIPANYVEAGKELVKHLWSTSQENTSGGRPGLGEPDVEWQRGSASSSYALPFRVRELLGIYGAVVKSAGVRVL